MRLSIDPKLCRAVHFPFVGIVEPTYCQSATNVLKLKDGGDCILESSILVCSRRGHHHMCASGFADALGNESPKGGNIQDVSSVDESLRSIFRKLRKAKGSLLRGNKCTCDIDCYIMFQIGQWKSERILRRGARRGADFNNSVRIPDHPHVPKAYHYKELRLGCQELF